MTYRLIILLFVCCTACTNWKPNAEMSIYQAINKAGYQRMLTQRIAKCYLSIVAQVETEKYHNILMQSTHVFESNVLKLKKCAPTEQIKDHFRFVELLWANCKSIYQKEFTTVNAALILKWNDEILQASHAAVVLLEEYAVEKKLYDREGIFPVDPALAALVNLSGRQRMLSQRVALYALAVSYDIGNKESNLQYYKTAIEEFDAAYQQLVEAPVNTATMKKIYQNIALEWERLKIDWQEIVMDPSYNQQKSRKVKATLERTDQLFSSLDKIVLLYEEIKN